MRTFTVEQAEAHLSTLIGVVEAGEDVLISREGRAVVRLTGVLAESRPIGTDDGTISIPADFDLWIPVEFDPYL
jgi:antitoxin (DNA-binding transcriptional repressor) of toxin-antitoxin stability system